MCSFLVFVPTETILLVVEENGVLVEREVVAFLLLEGGLVKVLPNVKIPAVGTVRFKTSDLDESALCQETGSQSRGRNVEKSTKAQITEKALTEQLVSVHLVKSF